MTIYRCSLLVLAALTVSATEPCLASPYPEWTNLAKGKATAFGRAPNDADVKDPGDASQLTDGLLTAGEPMWYDREARLPVGWTGAEPVEILVDLGEDAPIRGVALRAAAGISGVDWPREVRVLVSADGKTFGPVADLMKTTDNLPAVNTYAAVWLAAADLKTHGRFVKLVVEPADSGNGVYFYADELEIYRGEEEWISLPLPEPEKATNPLSPRPGWENLAAGAEVVFSAPPNDLSAADDGDSTQLTDATLSGATPLWADKAAVGWAGDKMVEFTVDLGKDQPIRGLAVHLGAGQAGVEWPTALEAYVSVDGSNFTQAADLLQATTEKPPESGYAAVWLVADALETHGRYVKFVISPTNLGNGAYVFLDEIEVYRGEDVWLSRLLAVMDEPDRWQADWKELVWQPIASSVPEAERPTRLSVIDGSEPGRDESPLFAATTRDDGVTFSLQGEVFKPRMMSWLARLPEPVSAGKCRFVVLTFRAEGIRRTYAPKAIVTLQGMGRAAGGNEVVALEANFPLNDGLSHSVVRRLPESFVLKQIAVTVLTDNDSARLTLENLELLPEPPALFNPSITAGRPLPGGFLPVSLTRQANGSISGWFEQVLNRHQIVQDGASAVSPGILDASGAPFEIGSSEKNLVVMPESHPSDERVMFLGKMVDKRFLDPVSRHDQLAVEVDGKAREVLLLLALSSPLTQVRGGIPPTALRLDDQESLTVELTYEDGSTSLAFPYSLADRSCYIPARALNAYAVAADPTRRLRKVTLHNRQFGPAFALAGLTLNISATALAPGLTHIPPAEKARENPEPVEAAFAVQAKGSRVSVANRWYEYEFDFSRGFSLEHFINRWNPGASNQLDPSSGLQVRVGNTIYTGRSFRTTRMQILPNGVEVTLASTRPELPLELTVTVTGDETPELTFVARGRTTGSAPLAAEVSVPVVSGLVLGEMKDTRVFFPQYRAVDTAHPIALRAPYGPEFAVQFMDVYNPRTGTGLMFRTDNATQRMLEFAMRKDASGVTAGVHFPAKYNTLAPGRSHQYPKVSLFAHGGDWSDALQIYTRWVRSWYQPHHSQDKAFFANAWNLMCYRTSERVSWNDARVPPIIEADRSKWHFDELLALEKQRLGQLPDFIHFFNWTYNDKKQQNEYGVAGTPLAYEQVGGIDFFRKGIQEIQTRWQVPVSLYTLIDRIRISAVPDQELVKELVAGSHHQELDANDQSNVVRAGGAVDGIVFLKPGNPRWVDFIVEDLVRMQKDTGCKLVYIDVFPSFSQLEGYGGTSPRDSDMMVIRRLRDELPRDVVIWTEYPLTDVASQYADGCLHYYFMDVSEVFARTYNVSDSAPDLIMEMPFSVQRFSTPSYKTIGLPTYIETGSKPSQVDAVFFNGEAIQEDTYRLHHSRIRERLNRGYAVKKQYTDCFNSPDPVPRVFTPVGGMFVNLFPGRNRQLWTFFNGRPQTYEGEILSVPHREGARYRDIWEDREIQPVIENGMAKIALRLDPQQVGGVVQEWGANTVAQNASAKN